MIEPLSVPPQPIRTSKSAIFSLIFGIFGCVPFIAGALAMLLGAIGFVKTGNPNVRGRWMAVVGGLLGTVSVVVWALCFGLIWAAVAAALGMHADAKNASEAFIRALSTHDAVVVNEGSHNLSNAKLDAADNAIEPLGTLQSLTQDHVNYENGDWEFSGLATFEKGSKRYTIRLTNVNGKWKVVNIEFH